MTSNIMLKICDQKFVFSQKKELCQSISGRVLNTNDEKFFFKN